MHHCNYNDSFHSSKIKINVFLCNIYREHHCNEIMQPLITWIILARDMQFSVYAVLLSNLSHDMNHAGWQKGML